MRLLLKIVFAPVMAICALICWLATLIVRVSGAVLGIAALILGILGIAVMLLVSAKNGIIILGFAFLVSPFGLPLMAAALVGQLQRFRCWMQDTIYG